MDQTGSSMMMGFAEEWLTDPKYGSWRHVFGCGFCLSDRARDARVECSQNVISTLLDSLYNELTVFRTLSVLRSIHHTILLLLFSLEISDNIFHLKAAFRYRRGVFGPSGLWMDLQRSSTHGPGAQPGARLPALSLSPAF